MVIMMFLALTILAIYAGIFVGMMGYRLADRIIERRDPEAIKRWGLDRRYSRLMMGRRKV